VVQGSTTSWAAGPPPGSRQLPGALVATCSSLDARKGFVSLVLLVAWLLWKERKDLRAVIDDGVNHYELGSRTRVATGLRQRTKVR
jgi:hypothetical protein